jgi:helicase
MEEFQVLGNEKIVVETKDTIVNTVLKTLKLNKQVLIFNNSKNSSEATGEKIALALKKKNSFTSQELDALKKLSNKILGVLSTPTRQCRRLAMEIEMGIAFHHSGLVSKQRLLIEENFKSGLIKVISSTPTLAAGLNLPAYKVIIKDYKRYSSRGFNDIPVLEFMQMAGRAGRPGHEDVGHAVVHVKDDNELQRVIKKYIHGKPEEIYSKLAVEPTLKMYVLSLVSMDMINTEEEIKEFFKNTLYGEQYHDIEGLYYNIFKVLKVLKDYQFIRQEDDYYVGTSLGKKVSELYLNPDTAHLFLSHFDDFVKTLGSKYVSKQHIFSLLQLFGTTMEMKPTFRLLKKEEEHFLQKADEVNDDLFTEYDPFEQDLQDFLTTLKTAEVLQAWIEEAPEEYVSDKYSITPGELHFKKEVVDWLLYCLEEFSQLRKQFYLKNYFNKLRQRFKSGIKEDVLVLISLRGVGRVRARKLKKAGFGTLADLRTASFEQLSKEIGDKLTISIKKELLGDSYEHEASDDLKRVEKFSRSSKPKEIRIREVSTLEIDELVEETQTFEKEKDKASKEGLLQYF